MPAQKTESNLEMGTWGFPDTHAIIEAQSTKKEKIFQKKEETYKEKSVIGGCIVSMHDPVVGWLRKRGF